MSLCVGESGKRDAMTDPQKGPGQDGAGTPILLLRFPDGDVEYRSTRGELSVGAVIRSRGAMWRVREYVRDAALLEPADPPAVDGAPTPRGLTVVPTGLGEEPLTVEILTAA